MPDGTILVGSDSLKQVLPNGKTLRHVAFANSFIFAIALDRVGDILLGGQIYDSKGDLHTIVRLHGAGSVTPLTLAAPADGSSSWRLTGASNVTAYIESSPDLLTWTTTSTNSLNAGIAELDIDRSSSNEFFRGKLVR